jgi:hypothetical protein
MTHVSRITRTLRWVLAPCASVAAFFVALHFSFDLYFRSYDQDSSSPLPPASAGLMGGFILGVFTVLTGLIVAPSKRVAVAASLFVVGAGLYVFNLGRFFTLHTLSACAGGLVACAFVAWWVRPHRTARETLWVTLGAVVVFASIVYAQYVDLPTLSDPLPWALTPARGAKVAQFTAFYLYELGGLIDTQRLWRIDANSDMIAFVVSRLELQKVETVPQRFWRMPPYYWPRSMPTGAEAYQSPKFSGYERGPDGSHYFLLHVKTQDRAYVWVKDNF